MARGMLALLKVEGESPSDTRLLKAVNGDLVAKFLLVPLSA